MATKFKKKVPDKPLPTVVFVDRCEAGTDDEFLRIDETIAEKAEVGSTAIVGRYQLVEVLEVKTSVETTVKPRN